VGKIPAAERLDTVLRVAEIPIAEGPTEWEKSQQLSGSEWGKSHQQNV